MHDRRQFLRAALLGAASLAHRAAASDDSRPSGDAVIRGRLSESEVVITTTSRLAGAIHSLTWGGKEFIDSTDHGRQLQSAANFDAGSPIQDETFNPTEAGSRRDGAGPTSTSRLLHLVKTDCALQTTTQMAFWLAPGEMSGPNRAKNSTTRSNHLLTKRVTIASEETPPVIRYNVTFGVPIGEQHRTAVFEAVTGYMPAEFSQFWKYNPETAQLEPLSDGPGEQPYPVVLATPDGRYAMGCYAPPMTPTPPGLMSVSYGRFRFRHERVVKWNCVFRFQTQRGVLPAGDYSFSMRVVVGSLETLRDTLAALHEQAG